MRFIELKGIKSCASNIVALLVFPSFDRFDMSTVKIKRCHKDRPLSVKLQYVARMRRGEKLKDLAAELGLKSTSTLSDWKKNGDKLQLMSERGISMQRCRDVPCKHPQVLEAMVKWIRDMSSRPKAVPIDHNILKAKANRYVTIFGMFNLVNLRFCLLVSIVECIIFVTFVSVRKM